MDPTFPASKRRDLVRHCQVSENSAFLPLDAEPVSQDLALVHESCGLRPYVPIFGRVTSRALGSSRVEVQQTAEPRAPLDPTTWLAGLPRFEERIAASLVWPLAMVMRDELGDGPSKVALPERHDAIQTFLFDGAYEGYCQVELNGPV